MAAHEADAYPLDAAALDIEDEFEDLGKDSDYLEDLARILENLGGLDTLVQELIQNADDAKASVISFDIGADGLVVDNDATFSDCGHQTARICPRKAEGKRPCDLHAFRRLAGASKRGQAGTTGAFGIGFTAVYQVTDRPELISAGQHIVVDETLDASKRARRCKRRACVRDHDRPGTRFILPWAREPETALRTALRIDPVTDATPSELEAALEETVPRALVFLRHVEKVDVRVEGTLRHSFKRRPDGQRLHITGGHQPREYLVLEADFATAVEGLRASHSAIVEGRETTTAVAVPLHGPERGLLYAGLPTHDETGFSFHINADFFPADDRRSLRWNSPPHASWNEAAIQAAARALADPVEPWRDAVGGEAFWASLRSASSAARQAGDERRGKALRSLWRDLCQRVGTAPIVRSLAGDWVTPADARRPVIGTPALAEDVLSDLGMPLVDRGIAPHVAALQSEIVVPMLGLGETLDRLDTALPSDAVCAPAGLPERFAHEDVRDALLRALSLLAGDLTDGAVERLGTLTLAPENTGRVGPLSSLWRCKKADRELFQRLDPTLVFLDDERLGEVAPDLRALCTDWDCVAAVDHIADVCVRGEAPPAEVLDEFLLWLARHPVEVRENADLKRAARALPIWPTTIGRRTLDGVALPSGRLDRLPLADTVDLARIPHTRVFLDQALGVKPLDLTAYCCEVLPANLGLETSAPDRRAVIETLGRIKADVLGDEAVREALRTLPLVECSDGAWRRVDEAYRPSPELLALLGADYPQATFDPRRQSVVRDVLEWLGLDDKPRPDDLLGRIDSLTEPPPTPESRASVHRLLDHLASRAGEWPMGFLEELKAREWMTADGHAGWHRPPTLYQRANRNWFSSQAKFHDAANEREKTDFLRSIGLETQPPAKLVTRHLLTLVEEHEPAPWTLYEYLDAHTVDAELELLADTRSILVAEDGTYARPEEVFQNRHPFGSRRSVLPQRLRGLSRLLAALDIDEEPSASDAAAVLKEIAADGGELAAGDVEIVHACWRMLQAALETDDALDLAPLGSLRVALDRSGALQPISLLLFNDAPSLAERLSDRLGDRLIGRQEDTWRALEDAGVDNLSDAIDVEILGAGEALDPDGLVARLRERAGLLARVVEAFTPGTASAVRAHVTSLQVDVSTELLVRYHLDGDDSEDVYRIRALFERDSDTLYAAVEDGSVAWTECAKELARALAPSQLPHTIAPSLRAAIEPGTLAEAETELNTLDVPRLEDAQHVDWEQAGDDWSSTAPDPDSDPDDFEPDDFEPASEASQPVVDEASNNCEAEEDDAAAGPDGDAPASREAEHEEPGSPGRSNDRPREYPEPSDTDDGTTPADPGADDHDQATDDGTSPPSGSRPKRRPTPRKPGAPLGTHYLETFLVVEPQRGPGRTASPEDLDNMAIDRAGTNAVLAYERRCGREPIRKSHSFRGYDVESYLDEELERLIEVKSIDGPWDAARARLSAAQFEVANEHGDLYWLYVVENARTKPVIWRIQDPGRRVHGFAYIPDWKRLAESDLHAPESQPDAEGEEAA